MRMTMNLASMGLNRGIGKALLVAALLLSLALLLGACGLTSGGNELRQKIAEKGATAADAGFRNAMWVVCRAAPIGAVRREFAEDSHIYTAFCDHYLLQSGAGADVIGKKTE